MKVVKFYSTMNIQRNIERYGKLTGITKKVIPHQLKHSIATHYLNNGMDIRRLQHFLGRRSLASTMIYVSITNDEQKAEINRLHLLNKIKAKLI